MSSAPDETGFTRRQFLIATGYGAAAVGLASVLGVLGGCTRKKAPDVAEAPIDFLGDRRQNGDPLYSTTSSAYVAVVPQAEIAATKKAWGEDLDPTIADGIIVLSEDCPHDTVALQFCGIDTFRGFICPACKSVFNPIGERVEGVAKRGMDRRKVSIDEAGELIIDPTSKVDGPTALTRHVFDWVDVNRCLEESVLPPNQRRRPVT
jgi:Rieske Fe-S protein